MDLLNSLADEYYETDPIRAESYARQALFIAESIQDHKAIAISRFNLGRIAQRNLDFESAMEYLQAAEKEFQDEKSKHWLARVYLYLSDEYKRNLNYETSLEMLFQARETFAGEKDDEQLAATLNAIGGNYYDQGNYEKAFEYFTESLAIQEGLSADQPIGRIYNNIGEIYRIKRDFPNAIGYYKKALAVFLRFNDQVRLALLYTNLGSTYFEMGVSDSATYYLNLGRELSDITGNVNRMSSVRIALGLLARSRGEWQVAHDRLTEGYNLAVRANNFNNMIQASAVLSELYEEKSDFKNAYNYFLRYRTLNDSIHDLRNMEKTTRMEMKLLYDLDSGVNQIKNQQSNLWYFTVAFILISFIVIIVLLYGRQRIKYRQTLAQARALRIEKMQLQEEIEHKNRELTTNVMFLVRKNEVINLITEKLLKSESNFKPSIRSSMNEILMELQSNVDENIWQVFEDRFKEVHRDFYSNLMAKFPKLTEKERKLCAFIRLNMSTKEIAAITHQNPGSIEVARTRLRKKLDISNKEISLNRFLYNI